MADSTSPIDLIATAQLQKEVTANDALNAASPAMLYARRDTTSAGLTWGYYGGRWGGASIANGTLSLTASATNYIVADLTTGAVSVSTSSTNFLDTANYLPLYIVVAGASTVTSYEDHRQALGASAGGGGGGTGDVVGPAVAVDNTLVRFDGTTGKLIQASDIVVSDDEEISGYRGHLNLQTGTSYTLVLADSGKVIDMSNAAAITLTMPDTLPVGFCCTVVQGGAGVITFTPSGGASRRNRQSHTKTAGQWAECVLHVRTNAGGTAAEYVLGGDTAT